MNRTVFLIVIASLLVAGCDFDVPLAPDATRTIDTSLLGTWDVLPEPGEEAKGEFVIVSEQDDYRYAIEHHDDESVIYFDGWLAELEGIPFIQLEVTGDDEGPAEPGEPDLYSVLSYEFEGNDLVIRSINTELVDTGLEDTASLQKAFSEHRENPALFTEPLRFRRR